MTKYRIVRTYDRYKIQWYYPSFWFIFGDTWNDYFSKCPGDGTILYYDTKEEAEMTIKRLLEEEKLSLKRNTDIEVVGEYGR